MHLAPSEGLPRNVAAPVVDMLYPQGKPTRIPIIAVTGTNGKTTTTRLISHIVKSNGYRVGSVSYTHLDVYKRQPVNITTSAALVRAAMASLLASSRL